jgi:hypothetical protein
VSGRGTAASWQTTGKKSYCGPEKNRMWLCRDHHDYFHAHPKEMHELGLMPHAWENQTWRGESEYLGNGGQNIA